MYLVDHRNDNHDGVTLAYPGNGDKNRSLDGPTLFPTRAASRFTVLGDAHILW
jgi:hypothetical protein